MSSNPDINVDIVRANLAYAYLRHLVPGDLTMIEWARDEGIVVQSCLQSPFADRTPSLWETVVSRVDGEVVSQVVIRQSTPRS